MTINKNNFEAYFLDYMEGHLDPLLTAELMAFLAENPDLEQYLPENDHYSLSADHHFFDSKKLLRKDFSDVPKIIPGNFDEFCVAAAEGLLDHADMSRLNTFLADHPLLQNEFETYQKLRLRPDLSITFGHKQRLKKSDKKAFTLRTIYYGLSIAASIAIVVFVLSENKPNYLAPSKTTAITGDSEISTVQQNSILSEESIVAKDDHPATRIFKEKSSPENQNAAFVTAIQTHENPVRREIIALEKIDPLEHTAIASDYRKPLQVLSLPETGKNHDNTGSSQEIEDEETLLTALLSKVDFWKTAETAINGFNQLTEAQLSISKTLDKSGNIKGLQFQTESYTIAGNNLK